MGTHFSDGRDMIGRRGRRSAPVTRGVAGQQARSCLDISRAVSAAILLGTLPSVEILRPGARGAQSLGANDLVDPALRTDPPRQVLDFEPGLMGAAALSTRNESSGRVPSTLIAGLTQIGASGEDFLVTVGAAQVAVLSVITTALPTPRSLSFPLPLDRAVFAPLPGTATTGSRRKLSPAPAAADLTRLHICSTLRDQKSEFDHCV